MSNLIARPVLRGFSFGLALVIAVKQWPHIVGMHVHGTDFLALLAEILRNIGAWQPTTLAVGACALAGLFILERGPACPGRAGGDRRRNCRGAVALLPRRGADRAPSILPWNCRHWRGLPEESGCRLVEFALALMFILYAESYSSIRTFALKHDDSVQPNRDLIALGAANIVSGAFQGTPVRRRVLGHVGQ